jgi:hypothetical protein
MSDYLIWSNEHVAWWRPGGLGYTHDPENAGRYERDEALAICRKALPGSPRGRPNDLPVPEDDLWEIMK